jgi:hypothetical protein
LPVKKRSQGNGCPLPDFYRKEKIMEMVRKGFLLGMLVIALAFGMTVIGCGGDDDDSKDPDLKTPVAGDYDIGNLSQTVGTVTAVTIVAKSGKSPGAVTIKYAGSTTLPSAAATYAVTFDVAAATGWKAATGMAAGNLVISGGGGPGGDEWKTVYFDTNTLSFQPESMHLKTSSATGGATKIQAFHISTTASLVGKVATIFDATNTSDPVPSASFYWGGDTFDSVKNGAGSFDMIHAAYEYFGGFGSPVFEEGRYFIFVIKETSKGAFFECGHGTTVDPASHYFGDLPECQ